MKQSLAALLLLPLIFAASLLNAHRICTLTEMAAVGVNAAEQSARQGDFELAAAQLEQTAKDWEAAKKYTYIFVRHAVVDAASDAFSDTLAELYSENADTAKAMFRKLRIHLASIAEMERIRFGSIF